MAYDNTNTGMLSKNDKGGVESRPDYRGSINIEGVEYWLSGWIKTGKDGGKMEGQRFFSLSVQRKDAKPSDNRVTEKPANKKVDSDGWPDDSDIPF